MESGLPQWLVVSNILTCTCNGDDADTLLIMFHILTKEYEQLRPARPGGLVDGMLVPEGQMC